jgi:hypothetical protein
MTETRVNSFSVDAHLISCHKLSETPNHQEIVESNGERLQKTRYGAPDGPRKRRENYKEWDPLDFPSHEALAHFLATPKMEREFKMLTALAKHFEISRMTIHRWKKDSDVLRRAEWLARENKLAGDFVARREWQCIVEAQVAAAKRGNTAAAKFLECRAWPEDQRANSQLSNVSLAEALIESEKIADPLPTWLRQRSEAETIDPAAGPGDQHDDGESGGA